MIRVQICIVPYNGEHLNLMLLLEELFTVNLYVLIIHNVDTGFQALLLGFTALKYGNSLHTVY